MVVRRCMDTNGGDGSEGAEGRGFHMVVWVSGEVHVRAIAVAVVPMTCGCASAVDEPAASTVAPPPVGAPPASSGFTPEQTGFLRWTVREAVEDFPTRGDLEVLEQRLALKIERESPTPSSSGSWGPLSPASGSSRRSSSELRGWAAPVEVMDD